MRVLVPLTAAFLLSCSSGGDGTTVTPGTDGGDTAVSDTGGPPGDSTTPPGDTGSPGDSSKGDAISGDGTDAPAVDTWTTYAQGFFKTYCVECHSSTSTTRKYDSIADVKRDKDLIRCGVAPTKLSGCTTTSPAPRQFPINNATKTNPKPTDADRSRLVAWIDGGLLE